MVELSSAEEAWIVAENELRAVKQELADFRQEVSDAVMAFMLDKPGLSGSGITRFITPKPDPLVAALEGVTFDHYPPNDAKTIRAALDALGFEIREKNDG